MGSSEGSHTGIEYVIDLAGDSSEALDIHKLRVDWKVDVIFWLELA